MSTMTGFRRKRAAPILAKDRLRQTTLYGRMAGILVVWALVFGTGSAEAQEVERSQEDARRTAALSDMTTLRDAEIIVQVDTNYYTSLENLNDLPGINTVEPRDGIQDQGGAWMLDPATGDWLPTRQDLDQLPFIWKGPYVTFQREAGDDGAGYDPGTPLDPWGRPYLLFSPLGLARPTIPSITLEFYGDEFDRWYIVSLAADGVRSDDDLGVAFGTSPWRTVISSAQVSSPAGIATATSSNEGGIEANIDGTERRIETGTAQESWSLRIRGYNFGASQETSAVILDGEELTDPSSNWSGVEILQPLPGEPVPGLHGVRVRVASTTTDEFQFLYAGAETEVPESTWALYE